jgi:threonine/homoserine/homoserine lactone efflux protein
MHDPVAFFAIVVVLTITPGADMALIMRTMLTAGRGATWWTLAGIVSGVAVHATLCIVGLSALLRQSDVAFDTVRFAGTAWLCWLGVSAIWAARRPDGPRSPQRDGAADAAQAVGVTTRAPTRHRSYLRGLATNLLNVKIALFYIAFLPQFAPAGASFAPVAALLALVQCAIGAAWLATCGLLTERAGHALAENPGARQRLELITGIALIGFGIRLAVAHV